MDSLALFPLAISANRLRFLTYRKPHILIQEGIRRTTTSDDIAVVGQRESITSIPVRANQIYNRTHTGRWIGIRFRFVPRYVRAHPARK